MRALSLRPTLALISAAVLSVTLAAVGVASHTALSRQLDASVTTDLEEKARGLHGYLRFDTGVPIVAYDHEDAEAAAFVVDATRYYQVYGADGQLLAQSPGMESLGLRYTPDEVAAFRATPGMQDVQTDRGRIRITTTVITPSPGRHYVVQVGEMLARFDATLSDFDRMLLLRTLIGITLAVIMGPVLAGWALAPLVRLARHAQSISIDQLQARLPLRGTDDELDRVAAAFNQALERLERSIGEMRQFTAALAHELRTPLAVLRGQAEIALTAATLSPAQTRERIASQIDEYDRLTRLINQILTLARAESGEIAMAASRIDLSAIATAVGDQVEALADAKGIHLSMEIAPAVFVRGDAGWIERLLLILLDNAIKFTSAGGDVAISLRTVDDRVVLAVRDSGVGISAAALPHVFEAFYRGDASLSRSTEGAGIGLALAKWIVDAHGATIEAVSTPQQGSRFSVYMNGN
ncbi:MAG: ATP-binding protein [Acidobacteriota bacterium]